VTTIAVPISDERLARLRDLATRAGVTPEEYVGRHLDELLAGPVEPFDDAAAYVLAKNAELYRRLS